MQPTLALPNKDIVNVFQYYSDIHIEHQSNMDDNEKLFHIEPITNLNKVQAGAIIKNNLILAGDIGSPNSILYWNFLRDVSQKFDRVFLIAGNHEHYNIHVKEAKRVNPVLNVTVEHIPELLLEKKLTNVFFLENQSMIIDDFIVMGCTMWSRIPDKARPFVLRDISDYRLIDNFTINKSNAIHEQSVQYLSDTLDAAIKNGIQTRIVITHHPPLMKGTSDPMYTGLTNHAFATDLPELLSKATHWIYGHTHFNPTQPVQDNMYTNQIGYKWTKDQANPYFLVTSQNN